MASTGQQLSLYAGNSLTFTVNVTDGSGNAVNLTGATVNWVLQYTVNDASALISKSTSNGITITDAVNGKFQVSLTHTDTQNLKPFNYYHEAVVTDSSGNVTTVTVGNCLVTASAKSLP